MVKTIDTVVDDIYELLDNGISDDYREDLFEAFGKACSDVVKSALRERSNKSGLRMSQIGKPCNRQIWYGVNEPEKAEPLRPETRMKFLYGHLIEELVLLLTELSGHEVTGRQDFQEIEGIPGHRDAVIDGTVTDVKSASTYSFKKFKEGTLAEDDPFGYCDQIQSYLHSGQTDDKVTDKDRAAFLVIDKTLGHLCLDFHKKTSFPMEKVYQYKKEMVAKEQPPARHFDPVPDGKSGNKKLGVNCSYCDFRKHCWPEARTFLYSYGPVHLVEVKREPNVPEAT